MRKIDQNAPVISKKPKNLYKMSTTVGFFDGRSEKYHNLVFLKKVTIPGGALLVFKFFFKIKTTHLRGTISLQGARRQKNKQRCKKKAK